MPTMFSQQKASQLKLKDGNKLDFLLFTPQNYNSRQKLPLIIFLHGAGEIGDDINLVKMHGPPKFLSNNSDFPAIVISPQCKKDNWWSNDNYLDYLNELYEYIDENFKIDKETVVLTGLSMGGYGSWAWANKNPEKFLSIVPICGGGKTSWAESYKNKRLWVFHGAKDAVVPIRRSDEMVAAAKKGGC